MDFSRLTGPCTVRVLSLLIQSIKLAIPQISSEAFSYEFRFGLTQVAATPRQSTVSGWTTRDRLRKLDLSFDNLLLLS